MKYKMKAKLKHIASGEVVAVTSTTEHPQSSYGKAVWVDSKNEAICQVGLEKLALYEVFDKTEE